MGEWVRVLGVGSWGENALRINARATSTKPACAGCLGDGSVVDCELSLGEVDPSLRSG
jgi:hypothetical protein